MISVQIEFQVHFIYEINEVIVKNNTFYIKLLVLFTKLMFHFKIKTRGSLDSISLTGVIYIDNSCRGFTKRDDCPAKIIR